ncbi:hypothetical protein K402DRAFT_457603 [Aulographum hederae CBS 113979]|uniref:Protein kinase domain-containing protein n=1 Tax=Aulographum hederae CBS 113979 TaxID=1176131 RepID=A0A6G1GML1_9PEZI|nr:hypothetical protein K402DRAFT_457603 [Aulographum hederae CBS 113979]
MSAGISVYEPPREVDDFRLKHTFVRRLGAGIDGIAELWVNNSSGKPVVAKILGAPGTAAVTFEATLDGHIAKELFRGQKVPSSPFIAAFLGSQTSIPSPSKPLRLDFAYCNGDTLFNFGKRLQRAKLYIPEPLVVLFFHQLFEAFGTLTNGVKREGRDIWDIMSHGDLHMNNVMLDLADSGYASPSIQPMLTATKILKISLWDGDPQIWLHGRRDSRGPHAEFKDMVKGMVSSALYSSTEAFFFTGFLPRFTKRLAKLMVSKEELLACWVDLVNKIEAAEAA